MVTRGELADALNFLDAHEILSVDTETTGLSHKDRLFSVQFATEDKAFYFDKRVLGEDFSKVGSLFDRPRHWVGQNTKFDMRMLHWEGWHPKGTIHDTEVLQRMVRNDVLTTKLSAIAKRYGMEKLDIVDKYVVKHGLVTKVRSPYWDKVLEYKHFDRVPLDIMAEYATHDARITYDLAKIMHGEMCADSRKVYANECELIPVCLKMELDGALIDRDFTKRMLEYECGLIHEAKREFLLTTGKVYDGTKQQLVDVFTKAGETIPKTEKGNLSLDSDALDSFTSPVAKIIQRIRHYEKRCSTYYSSFLDLADEEGRIHADMRQAGTLTGRFSYRDPNLQNIPKEDEPEDMVRENLIRRCFVPEKDHVLFSLDFSQQEYRLMLAYAGQMDLIEAVMAGADLHEATAKLVGVTRKLAKTLNFAILYGSGNDTLAAMLGIRPDQASMLKQKYFCALPKVLQLVSDIKRTVQRQGYVTNWYGRRIHLPGDMNQMAYATPNHLIQSGGADICKLAMTEINKSEAGRHGIKMIMQVHDQLVFQVPKDSVHYMPKIKTMMEEVFPPKKGMAMKVDLSHSFKSFAEADMQKGMPDGF